MSVVLKTFPDFIRHPANRIARSAQATPGVEGYVYDGADETQMAFWTCSEDACSAEHSHDYDDCILVVQGCYALFINGERITLEAGEEYLIPRGMRYKRRWIAQVHPGDDASAIPHPRRGGV